MNSEELEVSLRTEFESYLKGVFAEMRQEISQFQEKIDAELERHKSELDGVFSNVLSKAESTQELDAGFRESVVEHLRLAKDEGARITATAIANAEEMEKESAPSTGVKEIYEAVADISSKQSQSEILKSLVQHAGQFAARGAFFIIKNDHLVGWRVVGEENTLSDDKLREVFLPLSSDSVLSEAVKTLETVKSPSRGYSDDAEIFSRIELSDAQQMVAIPLVARGRGVAVLYADGGTTNPNFNPEALETLVKVAGLTVEVLASSRGTAPVKKAFVTQENAEPEQSATTGIYTPVVAAEPQVETEEPKTETFESSTAETYDYSAPAAETSAETESEEVSHELPTEPQPFYDPAPSIAPSVQEDEPTETVEAVTPEIPVNDYASDSYQTNQYQFEDSTGANAYQPVEYQPVEPQAESTQQETPNYYEPIQQPVETFPEYNQSEWSQPTETPSYSAQEYAENFAKETDPTEYAKEYSYQPEDTKTEELNDFSYQPTVETNETPVETTNNYSYETPVEPANNYQYEAPKTDSFNNYESQQSYNPPVETFTPTPEQTYGAYEPQTEAKQESYQSFEPVVSQPVQPEVPKTRLSERNVDLPIEVSEDERRLHNDARRFARLLVSEIKLYNEQKVKEGRDSGDLYDRLREAIDRSREMYDKRVQPPVAAKFDYFHYEIVNTLAEGDANKLGAGYPGPSVG